MSRFDIHIPGACLYALLDLKINGYLTWQENKPGIGIIAGVLLFTEGDLAEEYIEKVMPARSEMISVCKINKQMSKTFVRQMLKSEVDYALINIAPIAVDQNAEGELSAMNDLIRNYAIVDIKRLSARFL